MVLAPAALAAQSATSEQAGSEMSAWESRRTAIRLEVSRGRRHVA
jgi:hypothetical protein